MLAYWHILRRICRMPVCKILNMPYAAAQKTSYTICQYVWSGADRLDVPPHFTMTHFSILNLVVGRSSVSEQHACFLSSGVRGGSGCRTLRPVRDLSICTAHHTTGVLQQATMALSYLVMWLATIVLCILAGFSV
jgi:hypothetical protein